MPLRPHIQLNTKKQFDNPVKLSFNYGNPDDEESNNRRVKKDYTQMAARFEGCLVQFKNDIEKRVNQRNVNLQIKIHFDYIRITFQGQFNLRKYFQPWVNDFGLMGVEFNKFNHEILFAVVDEHKFKLFIEQLESFIAKESGADDTRSYAHKITYIKSFELLQTQDMLRHNDETALVNIKLIDFPLDNKNREEIFSQLLDYIKNAGLGFNYRDTNLEVQNATPELVKEIMDNFDIVLNVTSGMATVVRPDVLNLPEKTYGFEIANPDDNLPIIGILDTGISDNTPLGPLIIRDEYFNLTNTSVFEDNADGGQGHGTGVAALAALGKMPYALNYRGQIPASAKLLSMKIIDSNSGYLSHLEVLDLLINAKTKYPEIKLFVLTICYKQHKLMNENHSSYAYELDKFAHENDCLISICTSNNLQASDINSTYNIGYFDQEHTNICTPADSMNNIVIGAASHSLKPGTHRGISTSKEFPALYTRKSYVDLSSLYPITKINHGYFRPDVIECGGDYEFSPNGQFFGQDLNASMDILSADPTESFYSNIGTSFSAPLVANIAAKIQAEYPTIKAQSIKALIVNSASKENIRFQDPYAPLLNKVVGHGLVDEDRSITSNDNRITFLIEDTIEPEKLSVFPIYFPEYLTTDDLGKTNGILTITATLCFSFSPIMDNQMVYCPIHMAFSFFKNHTPDQIQLKNDDLNSLLKSSMRWSQNGRYKAKPVPAFNTQKIKFVVNKDELLNEDSVFKLGVNCRILSQLLPGMENSYSKPHPFSIAITIEESLRESKLTGNLYNEMTAINQVVNIVSGDLAAEAEANA